MQQKDSWLLPDGLEEILPEEAKHLENLRRKLLEMFACWIPYSQAQAMIWTCRPLN